MKKSNTFIIKGLVFIIPIFFLVITTFAQDDAYAKAKAEIVEQMGTFPSMFQVYPNYALPAAWESFKTLGSDEGVIPPKYSELLQLAVAAQIPCDYCIYVHTIMAKAHGATDEEVQEAVAKGAETRHWSMILQGNQVDLEEFKVEYKGMMKHMMENSDKE
jgi:AhpD family alkylhydroperoxidase